MWSKVIRVQFVVMSWLNCMIELWRWILFYFLANQLNCSSHMHFVYVRKRSQVAKLCAALDCRRPVCSHWCTNGADDSDAIFLFSISMRPRRPHVTNEICMCAKCLDRYEINECNCTMHTFPPKLNRTKRGDWAGTTHRHILSKWIIVVVVATQSCAYSFNTSQRFYNITSNYTARERERDIAFFVLSFVVFRSNKSLLASHHIYEERQTSRGGIYGLPFYVEFSHSSFSSGRSRCRPRHPFWVRNENDIII